ncbi:MAG: ceramidase [Gammaproteobacteria bacterium]|nr:ceramidase [Gammaproteobacteria bacterium]
MDVTSKYRILIGISVVALVAAILAPRIAQDPLYHQFADQNAFLSIPNTLNVLTNLLFGWIGIEGLYRLLRQKSLRIVNVAYPAYLGFFAALILIAAGSGYYHWAPDNQTLVWDRLPMTIAFISFFTIMLAERISVSLARMLFPVLIGVGIASIVYWYLSEQNGQGDLRPYALIQFLPMLLIPLILLLFNSSYTRSSDIWWFLAWYLVAKVCEAFDAELLNWLKLLSGHSLKHIAAGIGCLVFLRHLRFRETVNP